MRVLVTGATGLIGCHTAAALLRAGYEVRALVRNAAKLERVLEPFEGARAGIASALGDVTDPASVGNAMRDCQAVVHAAGLFSHEARDAALLRRTNVLGTETVLGCAVERGLDPIVHVSSMLALFPPHGSRMCADDPVTSPAAMYSSTKADAERIARRHQAAGSPVVTLYPASVQGPHDPTLGSGPEVLKNQLRAGRVLVTEGGLVYVDVRDLASLIVALMEAGHGPRRLLSTGEFVAHDDLHRMLCEITGRELGVQRMPGWGLRGIGRLGDLAQRWLGRDVQLTSEAAMVLTRSVPFEDSAARALLGHEPIPIERSLRDVLAWMVEAEVLASRHVGRLVKSD